MSTKDKLIEEIRAVPIAGKTYEEYVEALADKLLDNDYHKASEVAREIFEEIETELKRIAKKGYVGDMSDIFAELKKKYTESEKDNDR